MHAINEFQNLEELPPIGPTDFEQELNCKILPCVAARAMFSALTPRATGPTAVRRTAQRTTRRACSRVCGASGASRWTNTCRVRC